jgi:hypothetical protein
MWLKCVAPAGSCEQSQQTLKSGEEVMEVKWSNGSKWICQTQQLPGQAGSMTCTGVGPNGAKCVEWVANVDLNKGGDVKGVFTSNGKKYGMEILASGKHTITCPDGKVEIYDKGLCTPWDTKSCKKTNSKPPNPPCPPTMQCGPNGLCPPTWTCHPKGYCTSLCNAGQACMPCYACNAASGLCKYTGKSTP